MDAGFIRESAKRREKDNRAQAKPEINRIDLILKYLSSLFAKKYTKKNGTV
jgi:hypothetical protein